MELTDWPVLIVFAAIGYGAVSWLIDKYRKGKTDGTQKDNFRHDSRSNSEDKSPWENSSPKRMSWYEVLEVKESATLLEVKNAYRTKIQQYHPDRLEGMAPELYEFAMNKAKSINAAYTEAVKLKS